MRVWLSLFFGVCLAVVLAGIWLPEPVWKAAATTILLLFVGLGIAAGNLAKANKS